MNPKEMLENINELDLNDIVISDIDISDIEKERARKKIHDEIKKRKRNKIKKSIIAATMVFGIATTGAIATPTLAANIPIIGDIYRELGFFKGFEDYTSYIGETKEIDGYKFTLDNIVGTPTNILIGVKIESPVPINKNSYNDQFFISIDAGQSGFSSDQSIHYEDENTAIITTKLGDMDKKVNKCGNINVTVEKYSLEKVDKPQEATNKNIDGMTDTVSESHKVVDRVSAEFDINVDFTNSFNKVEKIKVNKKISNNLKIEAVESSIIGTDIVYKWKGDTIDTDNYYLEIDGILHRESGGSGTNDKFASNYSTVTYDDVKNAESINIIYMPEKYRQENNELQMKIDAVTEDGLAYPKTIVSDNGLTGEVYKIKKEDDTLKINFRSEFEPLLILDAIVLDEVDENNEVIRNHFGTAYKNDDGGYTIEFDDVNFNNFLSISYWDAMFVLYNKGDFETIKVK